MAGPNPYQLYSFREAHHLIGPIFVCCWTCRRYIRLGMANGIGERDHRRTTFSCYRCGGEGHTTTDDPAQEPRLADMKLDPVTSPQRHPSAAERLTRPPAPATTWRNRHREAQDRRR